MLASMTGGGSFRAEVNAEAAFERLGRELAGYYRLGVEKDPADQDCKQRRMKVQVSRGPASTFARARSSTRAPTRIATGPRASPRRSTRRCRRPVWGCA